MNVLCATLDAFWGYAWLGRVHRGSACVLLVLIAGHIAGVGFTSLRHRENLVAATVSGRKPARPQDHHVDAHDRAGR